MGRAGEEEWTREGRSGATVCSTFSICPESGAAHYRRVVSVELTSKVLSRWLFVGLREHISSKRAGKVCVVVPSKIITFTF